MPACALHADRQRTGRYDTDKELKTINRLYEVLRLYTNFFQPSMKLIEKTRVGSKITKKYSKPMTPYRRVMQSDDISEAVKAKLTEEYERLNPAQLKRMIEKLQERLWRQYNDKKKGLSERVSSQTGDHAVRKSNNFVYNLNEAIRIYLF